MRPPSPSLRRCEELWYEDGTVVLRAGNLLHRVYSGMLSRESAVLKTMFSLPRTDDDERYDGLPYVCLPDNEYEVTVMLKAIHYPRYAERVVKENRDALAALLQLGTKYKIPSLRSLAIARLEAMCPSPLDAFRALQSKGWADRLVDYKVMLLLSRSCNAPHVEHMCLWLLLPPDSSPNCVQLLREPIVSPASGLKYRLEEKTITTLLAAIWRCIDRYGEVAAHFVFQTSNQCETTEDCGHYFTYARETCHKHPLDILQPIHDISNLAAINICQECDADSKI